MLVRSNNIQETADSLLESSLAAVKLHYNGLPLTKLRLVIRWLQ